VPYREPKIEKVVFTIGEVADMLQVNPSLIRYWESRFSAIKPQKNKKGNRLYSKEDIETLRLIYHLVKERRMTIKGAQLKLRENREDSVQNFEIVKRLQFVKQQLLEIRDELES